MAARSHPGPRLRGERPAPLRGAGSRPVERRPGAGRVSCQRHHRHRGLPAVNWVRGLTVLTDIQRRRVHSSPPRSRRRWGRSRARSRYQPAVRRSDTRRVGDTHTSSASTCKHRRPGRARAPARHIGVVSAASSSYSQNEYVTALLGIAVLLPGLLTVIFDASCRTVRCRNRPPQRRDDANRTAASPAMGSTTSAPGMSSPVAPSRIHSAAAPRGGDGLALLDQWKFE